MDEHLITSLTVFVGLGIMLYVVPLSYQRMSDRRIAILQGKSIWADWRIVMMCMIYALAVGLRYNYAYDWWQYMNTFNYIQHGLLYRDTTEKGYLLINRILGWIGFDYYSIFILESFLWIFSICFVFRKNRRALLWVLPVVYLGCRFRCLNLSRQFFAMSVFFIGCGYLMQGKRIIYLVFCAIATSIHTSAILFSIPFLFIFYIRKYPPLKVILPLYIVIAVFKVVFFNQIIQLGTVITENIITNKGYDAESLMRDNFQWELSLISEVGSCAVDIITIFGIYYMLKVDYITADVESNKGNKSWRLKTFEFYVCLIGLAGTLIRPIGEANEITSRTFFYVTIFSMMSTGLWIFYGTTHWRQLNIFYKCMIAIAIVSYLYKLIHGPIGDVENDIILEYRI